MSNEPSTTTSAGASSAATGTAAGGPERIALLGGTFDPPHNGHLALARGVCDALGLERLLLIPAGNPHFKLEQRVTSVEERVAMTQLLVDEDPRFQLSGIEAQRPGVTYTADTLQELHAQHPQAELLFVVGADCLEHIWRWRRAEEIAQLSTLVAVARPGYDFGGALERLDSHGMGFKVQSVKLDTPNISSTQLRELAAQGASPAELAALTPPNVARYIAEQGIYRA